MRLQFTFNPWASLITVVSSRGCRQYRFASVRRYRRFTFSLMDILLKRGWHFCQEGGCVYLSAQKGGQS